LTAARRVVAVVLAAGRAERFGSDKLMHPLDGRPLGEHVAITIASVPFVASLAICPVDSPRRSVFIAHGFEIIDNPNPEQGMGTSLALGARRAIELRADAMLVCLADMPYVTREHLLALLGAEGSSVVTESKDTRTPPAVFTRELLPELAMLTGDQGARHLLKSAATVHADPNLVRDFDTPDDFD
jgi:CTP:molybdopterin cytidylyltransferase MocA